MGQSQSDIFCGKIEPCETPRLINDPEDVVFTFLDSSLFITNYKI